MKPFKQSYPIGNQLNKTKHPVNGKKLKKATSAVGKVLREESKKKFFHKF